MSNRVDLHFQVLPSSGTPIFKQIYEQVIRHIASGELKPGDVLPSIREVGRQLTINPMTISKSYSLLENEGVLLRKKGIGMQVTEQQQQDINGRLELIEEALEELALKAKQLNLDKTAVLSKLALIMER